MKHKTDPFRRVFTLLLCFLLLLPPVAADASTDDGRQDVTVNRSDSLSRLFREKTEFCLYCGELHTGPGGTFRRFFHNAAYFFCGLFGRYPKKGRMVFTLETLDLGADEPFYFIHAGDTHVGFIDERDAGDERLAQTAKNRERDWPAALRVLDDLCVKAGELDAMIVHTGDLIDFVSERNLDYARAFTANNDVFACAGNHEYHIYIWDDGEDAPRRERVAEKVQSAFTNDVRFSVRVEHGVKFIAVDNSFHRVDAWQLDRFREELADGMPAVLALHVPVYAPDIFEFQMTKLDYPHPAWLMAVPEELMEEYRYEQQWIDEQKANEATKAFYDLIVSAPNLKAILVGHDHANFVSQVTPTLRQYMVACDQGQIFFVR